MSKKATLLEQINLICIATADLLASLILMISFIKLFQSVLPSELLFTLSMLIYVSVNAIPLLIEYWRYTAPKEWQDSKWQGGSFKVYINQSGLCTVDEVFRYNNLVNQALKDWNKCKNIHLKLTNDNSDAQIRLYFTHVPGTYWAGLTTNENYQLSLPVNYNLCYLNEYSDNMAKAVIEHELGHAMGLGHSIGSHSVMYPVANNVTVTALDRIKLDSMYA